MARVLLIHGTFDGDVSETGDRWWQAGGAMRRDLEAAGHEIEAFRWSGENSDLERMEAAKALAKRLDQLEGQVTLLAHSHGGNVAREALLLAKNGAENTRVISVGTPFLDRIAPFSSIMRGPETIVLAAFFVLQLILTMTIDQNVEELLGLSDAEYTFAYAGISLVWLVLAGRRFFKRRHVYRGLEGSFAPVTHTQDEAVAAITTASRNKVEAVTRKSAAKSLARTLYPLIGVAAFVTIGIGVRQVFEDGGLVAESLQLGLAILPLFLSGIFIIGVIAVEVLSIVISPLAKPVMNGFVGSALMSSTLGIDSGASFARAGPSPLKGATIPRLPTPLEEAITRHANAALGDRIGLLRETLTTATQQGIDPMKALDESFTWDELIHTAYFRVPECRAFILEKVSTAWRA